MRFYSSWRNASAGRWRSPPCKLGRQRGGGRAGGLLTPDVNTTIVGDRPPKLGGNIITFVNMREFLVAYLGYEQQMRVANEDGEDRVLARRQDLA